MPYKAKKPYDLSLRDFPVACPDCGAVRLVAFSSRFRAKRSRCYTCAHKAKRPADFVPVKNRLFYVRCPSCGAERQVGYYHLFIIRKRPDMVCVSCARKAEEADRKGKHPFPHPPRQLSFDSSELVAQFLARGGKVRYMPVADLREPEFVPVPLPRAGWENQVLVPITEGPEDDL